MRPRIRHILALVALWLTPSVAAAQSDDGSTGTVRVRFDTLFRGVSRYALTATDNAASASDRYWRAISMAPLQERAALDASGLYHGHVEAHLAAWGSVDLAAPTADGRVAGDLAIAWSRYRSGPVSVWAGRRFVPWGAPGGVHVDGLGAEVELGAGFVSEVMVGRPVTPSYGGLMGPLPGFEDATAAGGVRLGWSAQGHVASSASFLEHQSHGIPTRRVIQTDVVATLARWMDLHAALSLDLLGLGVMQADVELSTFVTRRVELDVGYGHLDPALLIPRWSLLSVFVTRTWDEGRLRASWRALSSVQFGLEAAALHYALAGRDDDLDGPPWGSRLEAFVRVNTLDRRGQFLALASRRDDGVRPMTLVRLAGSFPVVRSVMASLEAASALDDDSVSGARTSWYARASIDAPITDRWRLGAALDGVRSPVATSEIRGLVHLTNRLDLRAGAR